MREITARWLPSLLEPLPHRFDYGLPEPHRVTLIINSAAVRKADERRFDRAHPALKPKRSVRRARRRRHLFIGSDRPGYRIPNVRISPKGIEHVTVDGVEDVNFTSKVIYSSREN